MVPGHESEGCKTPQHMRIFDCGCGLGDLGEIEGPKFGVRKFGVRVKIAAIFTLTPNFLTPNFPGGWPRARMNAWVVNYELRRTMLLRNDAAVAAGNKRIFDRKLCETWVQLKRVQIRIVFQKPRDDF